MKAYSKLKLVLFFSLVIILFVQADSEDILDADQTLLQQQEISEQITGEVTLEENTSNFSQDMIEEQPQDQTDITKPISDDAQEDTTLEDEQQDQEIPQEDPFKDLQPQLPGPKPEGGNLGPSSSENKGENWERTCTTTACTHTIYSYQKYYQRNELWQPIDEQFYSSSCQTGYEFCVTDNLYQVHMRSYPDTTNVMLFSFNGVDFKFKPHALTFAANTGRQNIGSIQRSPAQVTNNRAQYPSAFTNNFDMQFTYLPKMFKEDLIIKTKERLPLANLSQNRREITFDVEFTLDVASSTQILIDNLLWDRQTLRTTAQPIEIKQGETSFYLAQPIAYDARGVTIPLTYALENRQNTLYLTLKTPYEWLMNETRVYPVTIDPTITLDYTAIDWDGYLIYNTGAFCPEPPDPCNNPYRNSVTTYLSVGDKDNTPSLGFNRQRSDIDWNITSLPDGTRIIDLAFTLYIEQLNTNNDEFRFYHMIGGNAHYPNDDTGNTNFYTDVSDGTNYLNATVSSGSNIINLTTSTQLKNDLEALLINGTDAWSMGMRSEETGASGAAESRLTSSEGTLANRPSLTIVYEPFADEIAGDAAIVQGILNVFNNATGALADNQQVYLYNNTLGHQAGTLDALAINASKRWMINYATSGESFLNFDNMSTNVYSLELSDLTTAEITQRVEEFIRGTI